MNNKRAQEEKQILCDKQSKKNIWKMFQPFIVELIIMHNILELGGI